MIPVNELVLKDVVKLASGCKVPADCRNVGDYQIDIDESYLTGETLPVTYTTGDLAKLAPVVVRGECDAAVEALGRNTVFGRTME